MRVRKEKVWFCPCNSPNERCNRCSCTWAGHPGMSCCPLKDCRCRNSSSHFEPSYASPSSIHRPPPGTSLFITAGQATPAPSSAQAPLVPPADSGPSSAPGRCSMSLGILDRPSPSSSLPSNENPDQLLSPHTTPSPTSSPVLPSLDTILRVDLPTLHHVPKGVCND